MLKIRTEQLAAFSRYREKQFEDWMVDHIRTHFPDEFNALGESTIRTEVSKGVKKAAAYGFTSERDVCKFIDLMIACGSDFDRELWAQEILLAAGVETEFRIDLLCEAAINQANEGQE